MKERLLQNRWVTLGAMLVTAVADLIGLTWEGVEFGAGFVLFLIAFIYATWNKV